MTRVTRDVGGGEGLGGRRYQRYRDAFNWIEDCMASGHYLEAIAILDSLLCDRLSSRLGYVAGKEIESRMTCGRLCQGLVGNNATSFGSEENAAFRAAIGNIQKWVERRNKALHATAKVLRSDTSAKDFAAIVQSHRQDAIDGIKYLQTFDTVDTASRESAGKRPASYPNAFFPERRGRGSHARLRPAPGVGSARDRSAGG
jgi:hypothetical protein